METQFVAQEYLKRARYFFFTSLLLTIAVVLLFADSNPDLRVGYQNIPQDVYVKMADSNPNLYVEYLHTSRRLFYNVWVDTNALEMLKYYAIFFGLLGGYNIYRSKHPVSQKMTTISILFSNLVWIPLIFLLTVVLPVLTVGAESFALYGYFFFFGIFSLLSVLLSIVRYIAKNRVIVGLKACINNIVLTFFIAIFIPLPLIFAS